MSWQGHSMSRPSGGRGHLTTFRLLWKNLTDLPYIIVSEGCFFMYADCKDGGARVIENHSTLLIRPDEQKGCYSNHGIFISVPNPHLVPLPLLVR